MEYEKIPWSNKFDLESFPEGTISKFWLHLINNGIGEPIRVPLLIARGKKPGPVVGVNAALHGNELNGINVIQKLFRDLDMDELSGTVIGVLVANVPGVLLGQRRFNDNFDLNRQVPGSENGSPSSLYINRLLERVIKKFDYLIDLHTTGEGKQNCWHVRADMSDENTARMARLSNPELIIHSEPGEDTLRGYCSGIGIKSLTYEIKDPMVFQRNFTQEAVEGIKNILTDLKMIKTDLYCSIEKIIFCKKSIWTRSNEGGILIVTPKILHNIKEGEKVAEIKNIFGETQKTFFSPKDSVVIAKNVNPICQSGMGLLNIGYDIEMLDCLL